MTDSVFTLDTPHGPVRLEMRDPVSLNPAERNVMKHSDPEIARLVGSVGAHGFLEVPLYNERTDRIVAGHARREAAIANHLDAIPVFVGAWDATTEDALTIALQGKQYGDWDDEALKTVLAELTAANYDLDLVGLEPYRLDELLASMAPPALTDPDDVPELPAEPITKLGDVILLGKHRLMCGDSTSITDVERLMDGEQADMLWTDPPYGVAYQTKLSVEEAVARHRRRDGLEIGNDALTAEETRGLVAHAAQLAASHMRPGASFYVCTPSGDLELQFRLALVDADLQLRESLVWVKDVFVMGRQDYHWRHETMLYGWKAGAAHYFTEDRTQDSVWEIARPRQSKEHPTMKPVELIERAINNSSKPGSLVLDPFGGSGSTLIAAEQTNRIAYLMEIDPKYCDVIIARWQNFTGKTATRPDRIAA